MKSKLTALFAMLLTVTLGFSSLVRAGQVVKNSYEDSFPWVKGDCLVWQGNIDGDWEIFLYNMAAQEFCQITDNDYGDISPRTDGNYVVWLGFGSYGGEIFLYDISNGKTTQITNDTNVDSPPQIANGRVVWTSQEVTESVEPGEIFLHDIESRMTTPVSASVDPLGNLDDTSPRINDEGVMWVQGDDVGNTALFVYYFGNNGNGPEPAPEGLVWTDSAHTDGDLTVLTRFDGNDREIVVYNASLKTYEQITDNNIEDKDPRISGTHIAWVGGEGQAAEIYVNADVNMEPDNGEDEDPEEPDSASGGGGGSCFVGAASCGDTTMGARCMMTASLISLAFVILFWVGKDRVSRHF